MADASQTPRHWLQFGLRTFVILLPAAVALAYWAYTYQAARRARADYDSAFAAWRDERITDQEVLNASQNWLCAALAVPFADRKEIYNLHALRSGKMSITWKILYGVTREEEDRARLQVLIDRADHDFSESLERLRETEGEQYVAELHAEYQRALEPLPPPSRFMWTRKE